MANLSNCLKIHFGDKGDEFVANMVKDQANKIAGQGRVSQDIARQAVHNVIADFKADSAGIEQQIRSLISNIPKEIKAPATPAKVVTEAVQAAVKENVPLKQGKYLETKQPEQPAAQHEKAVKAEQKTEPATTTTGETITDFGSKIGGARKDTAERGYTMTKKEQAAETDQGTAVFSRISKRKGVVNEYASRFKPYQGPTPEIETLRMELLGERNTDVPVGFASRQVLHDPATESVQRIAQVFGKDIVWLKINSPNVFFNGAVTDKLPNKIFININASDPHLMVLGHETLHTLKIQSPEQYSRLVELLGPEINKTDSFRNLLEQAHKDLGFKIDVTDSLLHEELLSEFTGEQFMDKRFWEKLAQKEPTLFEKLVQIARDVINKAAKTFGFRANTVTSPFFNDIKKAQTILADVMGEYAAEQQGKEGNQFSRAQGPQGAASLVEQKGLVGPPSNIGSTVGTLDKDLAHVGNNTRYNEKVKEKEIIVRPGDIDYPTLKTAQEFFKDKGQVIQNKDGTLSIKFPGGNVLTVREVKNISDNQVAFNVSYGRNRAVDEVIAGSYKKATIKLVKNIANKWVIVHEHMHFMEDAGIITPGEAGLLENHIRGLVKQGKFETANPNKIGGQEDRANFIADQLTNPDPKAKEFIQKIVAHIQEFIDRLVNAFGSRTVRGVTRDIETGKIFNREGFGEYNTRKDLSHAESEPGLSSDTGPSGIASPSTQEEFSNQQEERFALLKSRKDIDQSKVDAELSNFDKSSFADSMATIKDMARNWGKAQRPGRPDTSLLGRFFGSPEFTFEKVPALKKVITYNLERADLRVEKFNDLISDPSGRDLHEGMRALQKERPEEYKKLGNLLVKADQEKRTLDAEQIKKLGFSDQAVASWADARAIMDNGFDRQIASYQEMVRQNAAAGLPPPTIVILDEKGQPKEVSVKTAIALMGEMRGWYWPRLRESGAYQIIAKATPEMKARGLHNRLEFKDFFVEHRAAELRRQGYQVDYFKAKSVPEDLFAIYGKVMGTEQMINEALNRSLQAVGQKSNFQFSDMGIKAMWSTSTDEKPDFILDTKKVPQELLDKVMPIFRSLGGRWYQELKGEPKYWHFVDKGKNIETTLRRALSRYDNRLLAVEEEFARALTTNVANIEKGRGYRSSMIQRGPEVGIDVWEGSEQDPLRAMTSYASRLASGEAKKETALKMIRAFNGTEKSWAQFKAENEDAEYSDYMKYVDTQKVSPTEQKNAYHDGLGYIQEALRNNEMADRVVGVIKGLASFKYLGFRVAAPIVNMTALITSVPAAMKGYADIPLSSTFKWLGKGADMWRQYRHPETWSTLPAETQAAFKIIQHKGWADSQYNTEAMAVLKSKVGRGWNQAMDASMWMFGTTEQLNRVATLMGTFAAIREREGGSKKTGALTPKEQTAVEKAMETAKKVSDRAHGVYGPATQPASAQGGGPAAQVIKSLYMFKKFQHNYLQTMYELGWKQKDWKAATFMMAAPTLLAGSVAFPIPWALEAIMGILKHLFGVDDPEEKFYSWMEKSLGDYVGGISRQGIAGMGGKLFDLRGSLNTKVDIPTNMIELLGAPGSVFSDLYQGGANILKGNVWKGTEKIMPRAVGTVMQGVREGTEGLTTKTNAPVFFGREQIKGDFVDTILRSLSFNPARIQKMKDIEWAEKQVSQDYTQMRSGIESQFLKFFLLPEAERDKMKMVDLIDQVHQYNSKVQSHGLTGVEPMITSTSLRTYIQRNLRPSKKELVKSIKREGQ